MHARAVEKGEKLQREIDLLRGENRQLKDRLYGTKSEKHDGSEHSFALDDLEAAEEKPKRRRGQQPQAPGPRRRDYSHLPVVEEPVVLSPSNVCVRNVASRLRRCPTAKIPKSSRSRCGRIGDGFVDVVIVPRASPACRERSWPRCRREKLRALSEDAGSSPGWPGRFVTDAKLPMDNNASERAIRGPAMGRKNYYGSGSLWSVCLTAAMFSMVATLKRWDLNPRRWLTWYLQSCAAAGGKPPAEIESFLPWNLSAQRRQELASRPGSASQPDTS